MCFFIRSLQIVFNLQLNYFCGAAVFIFIGGIYRGGDGRPPYATTVAMHICMVGIYMDKYMAVIMIDHHMQQQLQTHIYIFNMDGFFMRLLNIQQKLLL